MRIEKFPVIELSGTPAEIGFQHGSKLKKRIEQTIEFYTDVTKTLTLEKRMENEKIILDYANYFRDVIRDQNPQFAIEIEEIAKGAKVDPLWIYAINARSEIMSNMEKGVTECTALYFQETRILGQNWDWAADLENLSVIMKITFENGHEILQITEPGMIGKIGFNNKGLGVLLNFLQVPQKLKGFPVHLILRSILERPSLSEALEYINNLKIECAGNIMIGDSEGNYQDIEFGGNKYYLLENSNPVFIHTNHFLKDINLNPRIEDLQSSFSRYDKASKLISNLNDQSIEKMKEIL
ncbi:MAG: C45 family autoproteolytic acyltransferase/hydrolase, partial [Candidatus Heimdallarchaeota archaeon]